MLLLEQDTIKKKQVKTIIELGKSNNKKYKVKAIHDSESYAKELNSGYYLSDFYYFVL